MDDNWWITLKGIISEYSSLFLTQKYCMVSEDFVHKLHGLLFLSFWNLTDTNYHGVENIYVKILQNFSCDDLGREKMDLKQS